MKRELYVIGIVLLLSAVLVDAQMMGGPGMMGGQQVTVEDISHTKQEEREGLEIWEKLENNKLSCSNLSDEDFELLGEYFMGQMAGESHAAMNSRLKQMMGVEGEEQMHINMGKSYSGCANTTNTYGMMGWRTSEDNNVGCPGRIFNSGGWNYGMMGPGMMGGYGFFSPWNLVWLAFWGLVFVGLVLLVVWLYKKTAGKRIKESPLDIIKNRYAEGEITKKEFEEMKKEII